MLPFPRCTQIRHCHDLDHQARPAREMLRSLSSASLRVVLLPCEARAFPFVEDVVDEVLAEGGVDVCGLRFMRARLSSNILLVVRPILGGDCGKRGAY